MTHPDHTSDTGEARMEADTALERAQLMVSRGTRIALGWEKSRRDNNFRRMLRELGQKAAENGT